MARAKKPENEKYESKAVRFSLKNYDKFVALKTEFARRTKKKKITFDGFIAELFGVAELLITGKEVYCYKGRIYADIAEARGDALTDAIRSQTVPVMPTIMLVMGEDTFLRNANE